MVVVICELKSLKVGGRVVRSTKVGSGCKQPPQGWDSRLSSLNNREGLLGRLGRGEAR